MSVTEEKILEIIRQGEGIDLEFKTCRDQINRDVYESVCAFLNRHGVTIYLGVKDSGEIQGINPDTVEQIRKDFVTAINNPQKISPPTYLSVEEVAVQGQRLLRIYVPESSQVHRCNGRIYDRNEDGDLDITDHTAQVAQLYQRKQATYSENKIYSHAGLDELERDLIAKCRRIAVLRRNDHPWKDLDDLDLLKSAQLYQTDPESGKSGVTLAGLLLLGKRSPLLSAVPHHRTDLILRKVDLDRYDDRDFVDVNLVESYNRIMAFIAKHLPDPFYLEGTTSISLRDAIFREVASNILIHREYMNAFPAKLVIERGQVRTENSNKPHSFGILNPDNFTPFPKNPVIASFFRQIGQADELGSGMRKLMKYGKAYGDADPELIEGDIFRIIVKVPDFVATGQATIVGQVTGQVTGQVEKWILDVLASCVAPKKSSEIQALTSIKHRETFQRNYLDPLLENGLLVRTIPDKPRSRMQKYQTTEKGRDLMRDNA
jgi:ATP-dependent DNA helicase RecG